MYIVYSIIFHIPLCYCKHECKPCDMSRTNLGRDLTCAGNKVTCNICGEPKLTDLFFLWENYVSSVTLSHLVFN